ncbi:hypothetical protein Lac3_25810 [Claveliimonas bilis]|nr:hypothetical protein Lac3_25810 [Claveliimonas bilis]
MKLHEVWIRNNQGQEKVIECNAPDPRSAAEQVIRYPEFSVGWEIVSVRVINDSL